MDKSKAIKQSAEMFSNHLYENRKAKYKSYMAERKWLEKVVDDFEKHENIHILEWDIVKDTYRNNICVRFTDDNYPQYDVMNLVFDLFHSMGERMFIMWRSSGHVKYVVTRRFPYGSILSRSISTAFPRLNMLITTMSKRWTISAK